MSDHIKETPEQIIADIRDRAKLTPKPVTR